MMRKIHGEGDRGYLPMERSTVREGVPTDDEKDPRRGRQGEPTMMRIQRETGGTYR